MPADSLTNASKTSNSSASCGRESSKIPNNSNINKREFVLQRVTSHTLSSNKNKVNIGERGSKHSLIREILRKRRTHHITFRMSDEELDLLEVIMEKRGFTCLSWAVREAIKVYAGLLSGAEVVPESKVIIQNPNVVINEVEAKVAAVAESSSETSVPGDLSIYKERVRQLREQLRDAQEVIKYYKSKNAELSSKVKQLEKELGAARRENEVLKLKLKQASKEALQHVVTKIKQRAFSVRAGEQVKLLLLKLIDSVSEEITDLSPESGG